MHNEVYFGIVVHVEQYRTIKYCRCNFSRDDGNLCKCIVLLVQSINVQFIRSGHSNNLTAIIPPDLLHCQIEIMKGSLYLLPIVKQNRFRAYD